MNDVAIPERLDELTPAWLSEALGRTVTGATTEMLGEGEGFLGDIARMRLTYDGEPGPETLIAKLPKLANRGMGELLGAYERETLFYLEVATELPLATPSLYYGDFDRDKGSEKQREILAAADKIPKFLQSTMTKLAFWIAARKQRRYILLMEDMHDAAPGDQLQGVDRRKCALVLQEIAKAHAAFWDKPLADRFWLLPFDIDKRLRSQMFRDGRESFAGMFQPLLDAGLAAYVEHVAANAERLVDELAQAPATLLHNDLRLDNIFFRGDDVIVFDWQLVRTGPAVCDVAYFLSGALDDDEPVDELLATYHAALVDQGIDDYPLDRLKRDYATALHLVLANLGTVDQVEFGNDRGEQMIRRWIERLFRRLQALG